MSSQHKFRTANAVLEGLNSISDDSYFLRLKKFDNQFIHFEGDSKENPDNVVYVVKEGTVGACVFNKQKAQAFMKLTGTATDMELVKVTDILKNDGSLN